MDHTGVRKGKEEGEFGGGEGTHKSSGGGVQCTRGAGERRNGISFPLSPLAHQACA